jgi:hypothetical protein
VALSLLLLKVSTHIGSSAMDHVVTAANLTTETWKAAVVKTFDWYKDSQGAQM